MNLNNSSSTSKALAQKYHIEQRIGSGPRSEVHLVRRKEDDKVFVCKKIGFSRMNQKEKHQLVEEVNILKELKNDNIVRYHEFIIDKTSMDLYVVMQYCEGGDLESFLKQRAQEKKLIPEESIWRTFTQLLLAVYQIHRRKEGVILHRDIKPANIFLDSMHNVKLGDFGLARRLDSEEQLAYTRIDRTYYFSPEQLNEGVFTEKTDIWACGCLLYQMASLRQPFAAETEFQMAQNVKSGDIVALPQQYSKEFNRVVRWCLAKNPKDRPNIEDLINIPQVTRRIKQKRLEENLAILKKKEEELIRKEMEVRELEERLEKMSVHKTKSREFGKPLLTERYLGEGEFIRRSTIHSTLD